MKKKSEFFVTNSVNIIFLKPFVTYLSFIPRKVKKLKQFDKTTPPANLHCWISKKCPWGMGL